jgi:transcriptional regulator with XRE-family HTH domain
MSQMQLGEMLHIGLSAVGMYEQGRRTLSIDTIIRLAIVFGVSLDYLITGKEAACILNLSMASRAWGIFS